MSRSITGRERRFTLAGIALCLALAALSPRAVATETGGIDTVRSLYDTLLATMQNGPALGPRGRYARIAPVVHRVFDIPFMTRLAVGPGWTGLTDAQRQDVSQAFERYVAAIYAERFDSYSGERLQVTGEQPSAGGTVITSQIIKSNNQPVNINYLMHYNGGVWQIADVYLNGTISELATRRAEFAVILRAQGITGLIETLNAKANTPLRTGRDRRAERPLGLRVMGWRPRERGCRLTQEGNAFQKIFKKPPRRLRRATKH